MTIEELEKQNIVLLGRLLEIQEAQFCLMEQYLILFHDYGDMFAKSAVDSFAEGGYAEVSNAFWPGVAKDINRFYEMIKNARNNADMV